MNDASQYALTPHPITFNVYFNLYSFSITLVTMNILVFRQYAKPNTLLNIIYAVNSPPDPPPNLSITSLHTITPNIARNVGKQ